MNLQRDIVQFVPMRDFKDADPAKLAAETLVIRTCCLALTLVVAL